MISQNNNNDVSIVLCGAAGQGIQTVEALLTKTLKRTGYHVFATREYMSRVRGGVNSTTIHVSSEPIHAFVDRIDLLIPLDESHGPYDQEKAMNLALNSQKFPLGILYINPDRKPFEENMRIYNTDKRPLYQRELDRN